MRVNENLTLVDAGIFTDSDKRALTHDEGVRALALVPYIGIDNTGKALGFEPDVWKEHLNENPELRLSLEAATWQVVSDVGQTLVAKALGGDVNAMKFYLERKGGWKENKEVDFRATISLGDALKAAHAGRIDQVDATMEQHGIAGPKIIEGNQEVSDEGTVTKQKRTRKPKPKKSDQLRNHFRDQLAAGFRDRAK